MKRRILFYLTISILISSCSREKYVNIEGMKSYISNPKNGLRKQKVVGDYILDVSFIPDKLRDTTRENTKDFQKIIFKIQPNGLSERGILDYQINSDREYFIRLEYFNTYVQNDMYLMHGESQYPCAFTHFERYHGLGPYNTLTAYFEMPDIYTGDVQLVYDDHILNMGLVKFLFNLKDIEQIPQLKYQIDYDKR